MFCAAAVSRAETARPAFVGDGSAELWEGILRAPIDEPGLAEGARRQLAMLRLIQSARDINLCDKQAVIRHFGPWLGEMLELVKLEGRSAEQRQRLNDLYEDSLGFLPDWSDQVRNPEVRCGLWLNFGSAAQREPRLREFKPFDLSLASHVFTLCATSARRLPHGQTVASFVQCRADPSGIQIYVGLFNGRVQSISIILAKAVKQPG